MSLNVKPRKFSVEEYALMGEAGVFGPGERVELIEGEIIPLSPQNKKHGLRIAKLTTLLVFAFGRTHDIRVQLPLTLGANSEPEPDFALVPLELSEAGERHPRQADLVLEISDSSLTFDRQEKASVYAKAGIPEYWILNLRHQRLEIRQNPVQNEEAIYAWDYASLTVLAEGQSAAPLFAPEHPFEVSVLLGAA